MAARRGAGACLTRAFCAEGSVRVMGVDMFDDIFGRIQRSRLLVVTPGKVEHAPLLVVEGLFEQGVARHVGGAAVDLSVQHDRMDRLACVVALHP